MYAQPVLICLIGIVLIEITGPLLGRHDVDAVELISGYPPGNTKSAVFPQMEGAASGSRACPWAERL